MRLAVGARLRPGEFHLYSVAYIMIAVRIFDDYRAFGPLALLDNVTSRAFGPPCMQGKKEKNIEISLLGYS